MKEAPTPRRRADATRNDERLLDTGLELLREKGPDRLAALDLARRAGLTTGAVYARYENNEEILVGLWQNRLVGPLREFLTQSLQVLTSDDTDNDPVGAALHEPSTALLAAVSVLIVAPRITELSEVVIPDMREILFDLGISENPEDLSSSHKLVALGTGLGCLYFAAADMFSSAEWPEIRSMLGYIARRTTFDQWPAITPRAPFDFAVDTGQEVRDAFVNAAARVITRSGIERATTQRVARAAGLPPSALFAEYQNRQALFSDVVEKLLRVIYQENRFRILFDDHPVPDVPMTPLQGWDDPRLQSYRTAMHTSVAESAMGLLGDVGHSQRRIRLEFQLAAIHNEEIRAALQRIDESTILTATEIMRRTFGFPSIFGPGSRKTRTIAQGAMLLEDVSHMLAGRDLRPFVSAFADYSCLQALGLSTEPSSAVLNHQ